MQFVSIYGEINENSTKYSQWFVMLLPNWKKMSYSVGRITAHVKKLGLLFLLDLWMI